jgi:hypothetical protein
MIRNGRTILLALAVLLLVLAFVHYPVKAGTHTATSRGVTLIVLGCGEDPNNTQIFGPGAVSPGGGWCDGAGQWNGLQFPSGTLYNLRATVGGGTSNINPATFKVMVHTSSSAIPLLVCEATTRNGQCQDLTHSGSVKAGDTVSVSVSIPDSNTWVGSIGVTMEENIVE